MKCPSCQKRIPNSASFCEHCGASIPEDAKPKRRIKFEEPVGDISILRAILRGFKKYLVFWGRATRKEFWCFFIFAFGVAFCLSALAGGFTTTPELEDPSNVRTLITTTNISILWDCFVLIPIISCYARRMHDIGKSGLAPLKFIPTLGIYAAVAYIFTIFSNSVEDAGWFKRTMLHMAGADVDKISHTQEIIQNIFIALVSIYILYIVVLLLKDSQIGDNEYGNDPKG